MKNHPLVLTLLACGVSFALPVTGRAHGITHHALFQTSKSESTIYGSDRNGAAVTVKWEAVTKDAATKDIEYTLTLTRDPKSPDSKLPFSLYNLRLQGRLWSVDILEVVKGGVKFLDGTGAPLMRGGAFDQTPKIPRATEKNGSLDVDEKKVYYLEFTGSDAVCVLKVKSYRPIRGKLSEPSKPGEARAKNVIESHDTMPPPPEPGGEEGEEEEEEGEQMRKNAAKKKK